MTPPGDTSQSDSTRRAARIRKVVEECMRRRAAGEVLNAGAVVANHADLSPELDQELAMLAVIERARERASGDSRATGHLSAPPGPSTHPKSGAFPGYEIVAELHRGGQGVVYQALQNATKRRVAIKVMHGGPFARARDRLRFEREVQILAQLDHPNIVSVHDGGSAEGSDFLVMDFVAGEPLDEYLRGVEASIPGEPARKVEIKELLRLFVKIGDAVNAAHLRGVIHRDLKPSNILIVRDDKKGLRTEDSGLGQDRAPFRTSVLGTQSSALAAAEPKVLDFGLAKYTTHAADDSSPTMTVTGQFVGSLPWSSPEQAAGEGIDTRTDVYSLGVMLFQCLTGRFPYPVAGRMSDVLNHVRFTEPIRPRSLRADIDDEVETIVLKCLSKDRERRYQTAGELVRDIARYLAGEPIEAKRDSALYVLRKHFGRHKGVVATVAGFVLLLTVASVALSVLYRRAETQAASAEQRRQSAERVAEFMSQTLQGAGPAVALGRDATMLEEMMNAAAERIEQGELSAAPEAELRLRLAIGDTYRQVAAYDAAARMLEPAVELARTVYGPEHAEVAASFGSLGRLLFDRGQTAEALDVLQQSLDMSERLSVGDHPVVAEAMNSVASCLESLGRAAEALPKYEAGLAMHQRLTAGDHAKVASSLSNVAGCLESLGRSTEALPKYEEALAMRRRLFPGDHPDVADSLNTVGFCLRSLGQTAEAVPKYEMALGMYQRLLKGDHPLLSTVLSNIGASLLAQDRAEEALSKFEESLEMTQRLFPGDHPEVAKNLNNVGGCLRSMGRPAEALPRLQAALDMWRRLRPEGHPDLAMALSNVASCLRALNRLEEALPEYEAALAMWQNTFEGDHPDVARGLNNVAQCLLSLGRPAEALPQFEAALEMNQRLFTEDHPHVAICLYNVAACLRLLGKPDEAHGKYEAALEMRRRLLPVDHIDVAISEAGLGSVLVDLNRLDEAEPLLKKGYAALAVKPNAPLSHRESALKALVKLYEARHAAQPEEGFDAIAQEWRAKLEPGGEAAKMPSSSPAR